MVTTVMRLQELGNINLPLIHELTLKAPEPTTTASPSGRFPKKPPKRSD